MVYSAMADFIMANYVSRQWVASSSGLFLCFCICVMVYLENTYCILFLAHVDDCLSEAHKLFVIANFCHSSLHII